MSRTNVFLVRRIGPAPKPLWYQREDVLPVPPFVGLRLVDREHSDYVAEAIEAIIIDPAGVCFCVLPDISFKRDHVNDPDFYTGWEKGWELVGEDGQAQLDSWLGY